MLLSFIKLIGKIFHCLCCSRCLLSNRKLAQFMIYKKNTFKKLFKLIVVLNVLHFKIFQKIYILSLYCEDQPCYGVIRMFITCTFPQRFLLIRHKHMSLSRLTNAPTRVSSSAKDHENENGILYNNKIKRVLPLLLCMIQCLCKPSRVG